MAHDMAAELDEATPCTCMNAFASKGFCDLASIPHTHYFYYNICTQESMSLMH